VGDVRDRLSTALSAAGLGNGRRQWGGAVHDELIAALEELVDVRVAFALSAQRANLDGRL
jgi:hypothetical protein